MLKGLLNFFSLSKNKKEIEKPDPSKEYKNSKTGVNSIDNFNDLLEDTINIGSISLDDPNFVGESISSKNQKYILAWLDAEIWEDGFHMGDRKSGYGSVMLISNDMIFQLIENIQRPSFGKVSNVGVFIITDITFERDYN